MNVLIGTSDGKSNVVAIQQETVQKAIAAYHADGKITVNRIPATGKDKPGDECTYFHPHIVFIEAYK